MNTQLRKSISDRIAIAEISVLYSGNSFVYESFANFVFESIKPFKKNIRLSYSHILSVNYSLHIVKSNFAGFYRKRYGKHTPPSGRAKPCWPKLVVAFFDARFDVTLAVSRPETASMALPVRPVGYVQWPFAAKADILPGGRGVLDYFPFMLFPQELYQCFLIEKMPISDIISD
ncbi:MAG: hypothetical protein FWC45_08135 [Treponema sp.]|nr:hypothetical protein [Treponema sp.]